MTSTIALTESTWAEIVTVLHERLETAGVVSAGTAEDADNKELTLLGRELRWVPPDGYLIREPDSLSIASTGYVPWLKSVAAENAAAMFLHSHPGGRPSPSRFDRQVDLDLRELFMLRTGRDLYVSLIVGGTPDRQALSGLIYRRGDDEPTELDRVRIVGDRVRIVELHSAHDDIASDMAFDRQVRAFGGEGQRLLSSLRVGVVGAGGTGSSVCEQLIRLGVREIVVADDDAVDETNITRIYGAGRRDVGRPKVDIVVDNAARIGLGTVVQPIEGRVTSEGVARELRHCDVVFGCTDDHAGRAVLARLAYWYLIPVIDMGFVIASRSGIITGLYGRITTMVPGTPCLICRGRIDPEFVRAEMLRPEERARLADEGYAPGLGEPDPSVVTYTTMTASIAVSELLERLIGYGSDPPSELLVRVHDRKISQLSAEGRPGHYCGDARSWGRGDTDPFLGQVWA